MASLCRPYYKILSTSQKIYAQLNQNIDDSFIENLIESEIKVNDPGDQIYLFYDFKENNSHINIGNWIKVDAKEVVKLDIKSCKTIHNVKISKDNFSKSFSKTYRNMEYPYEYFDAKNYFRNDNQHGSGKFIFIANVNIPDNFNGLICIRKNTPGVVNTQLFCKEEFIMMDDAIISFDIIEFDAKEII